VASSTHAADLEPLLEYIRSSRGFDFTGYKRPTLQRRIEKRMQTVRAESYEGYKSYLEGHPDEFVALFNTILINVTAFFRDAPVWDYLRREIVPEIVEQAQPSIRIWSTGCASGEEAYSLAMCFAEALPEAEVGSRLKIYATDVDEEALSEARHGSYTTEQVEHVPSDLRARYFEQVDQHFRVVAPLRRAVIFGRHDIVQDPPISRIDLLASRNTLMYFTPEAQRRIVANFHFALNNGGYLLLGKSEMMLGRSPLFTPADMKRRVFRKAVGTEPWPMPRTRPEPPEHDDEEDGSVRDAGFESGPVAQLIIDLEGHVSAANLQARTLFNLALRDVGRPLKDLEVSYRPVELRSQIEKAHAERHAIALRDVEWTLQNGQLRVMDVQVAPLFGGDGSIVGVGISFVDMTRHKRLQEAVEHSKRDIETAYEELQSTSEELETTNEELQSTNEELETTNEELQSSNEELETMNEELQSTNEELQTINDELNQRTEDLNQTNYFLESILGSLNDAVVVLDEELRVHGWNERARDLWGLSYDDVHGKHFMNLDIGLPVDRLRGALRAGLAGDVVNPTAVDAIDRRGRAISCRIRISPVAPGGTGSRGVILFMEATPQ
jgi:two-component system CheB/CheR fusion protein